MLSNTRAITVVLLGITVGLALAACGTSPTSTSGVATPAPTVTVTVTPTASVTPSPAIAEFVACVVRADQHLVRGWAPGGNYTLLYNQVKAARRDINAATTIEPAYDGSKQWRLANQYGVCVANVAHYSVAAFNTIGTDKAVGERNSRAAAIWAHRAAAAVSAYLAYVKQLKAAVPTGSATPASAKAAAATYRAYGKKVLQLLDVLGKKLNVWPASETGAQAERSVQPLIVDLRACAAKMTDYPWPSGAVPDVHTLVGAIGSLTGNLESIPSDGPFSSPSSSSSSWGAKLLRDQKTVGADLLVVGHDLGFKAAG